MSFTILEVGSNVRDWNSTAGGPMKAYRIVVKDDAGNVTPNVEWSRKERSAAPVVGDTIDGTLDTSGQYGPKFKQASGSFGGGGGGGGGRPRDPAERKSIQAQHAQKCAVEILRVAAQFGDYKPTSAGEVTQQAKVITAALVEQIESLAA